MNHKKDDIEKFQYDHIFNLILGIFKFNEKKYGNFVISTLVIYAKLTNIDEPAMDSDV